MGNGLYLCIMEAEGVAWAARVRLEARGGFIAGAHRPASFCFRSVRSLKQRAKLPRAHAVAGRGSSVVRWKMGREPVHAWPEAAVY